MAGWGRQRGRLTRVRITRDEVETSEHEYDHAQWWSDWRVWWLVALTISQIAYMIVDAFV